MKDRYCHICKQKVRNATHLKLHKELPMNIKKLDFYLFNFPKLKNQTKIKKLYEDEKYSLPMLCKYANGIDLKALCFVMDQYGIKIRSISDALHTEQSQNRYKNTCIKKYGAPNCLSKGTKPYFKRNKTVQDKYGVENVFQIIDEFMKEHGTKYSRSKISSLNIKFENILKKYNFLYETEFKISYINDKFHKCYKFYDFHILNTNLLIEVNGDYWHANPKIYKENDKFQFPKTQLTAKDIWKLDEYKNDIAKVNNYRVIYVWENELENVSELEIVQKIKDSIN